MLTTAGSGYEQRPESSPDNSGHAIVMTTEKVAVIGFEHPSDSVGISTLSTQTGAPATTDPDLASLLDAWPTLPGPIRAGILAMVKAAHG